MEQYSIPTMKQYGNNESVRNINTSLARNGNVDMSSLSNTNMELENINRKIVQIQNEYYLSNTKKNIFGKNNQKKELAENVCGDVGINNMLQHTTWIIYNTNCVYFDYHMFKMFAHDNNYMIIVNEVMNLCKWCIQSYGKFSVHINLLGFSISAVDRYKHVIEMFCSQCLSNTENYSDYLENIYVYNTPQFIENISKIMGGIIPQNVKEKVKKLNKQESVNALNVLFSTKDNHANVEKYECGSNV
jgi:hypothetical protein